MFHRSTPASFALLALTAALAACSPAPTDTTATTTPAVAATQTSHAHTENSHGFRIGDLQATALRDGTLAFPNDNQVFGIGQTPEAVAAVLQAAGLPNDALQLGLQPLLVQAQDRVLLFDTGAGNNFGAATGHLAEALTEAGITADSVTDIFISHAHGDHVGGLVDAQGALVFPKATVHLSAPEWHFLQGLDDTTAKNVGIGAHTALTTALAPKVVTFEPGADILPGMVKAVEIKGHTPGHSGYLIGTDTASLLYIGDALHHSVVSVQKPEWANGFDGDAQTASGSRSDLLESSAAKGQRIYAVHFPFPGLGKIVKDGDSFLWVAE